MWSMKGHLLRLILTWRAQMSCWYDGRIKSIYLLICSVDTSKYLSVNGNDKIQFNFYFLIAIHSFSQYELVQNSFLVSAQSYKIFKVKVLGWKLSKLTCYRKLEELPGDLWECVFQLPEEAKPFRRCSEDLADLLYQLYGPAHVVTILFTNLIVKACKAKDGAIRLFHSANNSRFNWMS